MNSRTPLRGCRRIRVASVALALFVTLLAVPTAVAPVATASPDGLLPSAPSLVAQTRDGDYLGRADKQHLAWLGIHYAKAPTGRLRFRAPVAKGAHTGVRPAVTPPRACPQQFPVYKPVLKQLTTSGEDCLALNVYRPTGTAPAGGFPVMVFVPGGAYVIGDGYGYDPTPLVERGQVIVVTMNYRLGPLGFLTLPGLDRESSSRTSGNWGLLDQQLALRWVRDNVSSFGGDADNLTLFGQSAGGNSVCEQLASPLARGLFDRAIPESGACVGTPLGPLSNALGQRRSADFARSMGCTDARTAVACLRALPARKLVSGPTTSLEDLDVTWAPTLDGRVLARSPERAFRTGTAADVPLMIGNVHDEGRLFVALFFHVMGNPVSEAFYRGQLQERYGAQARNILARYPSERYGSPSLALSATITDELFACPALWTTRAAGTHATRLYSYELDDSNPPTFIPDPFMDLGNFHGAELSYLFDSLQMLPVLRTPSQDRFASQLIGYWSAFARSGDPNGAGRPSWPLWSGGESSIQRLTSEGSAPRAGFAADHQCGFWATPRTSS